MNSAMLSQVMLNPAGGLREKAGPVETVAEGPSFSQYLEKRAAADADRKNQLGADAAHKKAARTAAREAADRQRPEDETPESAAAFLALFLTELKDMARTGADGEGHFSLRAVDGGLFPPLAEAMGVSQADMNAFLRQISEMSGGREMENFLTMLIGRLRELAIDTPVTVAETELPFIQSLLSQMGAQMDDIAAMTEPAVTGDNTLDLGKLLEGLKGLTADGAASLSGWDAEQLQNILAEAGLDIDQATEIFRGLSAAVSEGQPLSLNLDQLASMLEKAVQAGEAEKPQVDAVAFMNRLGAILEQTAAEGAPKNWNPLLQDSLQAVYERLQQIADISRVTIERREQIFGRQQYLAEQAAAFRDMDEAPLADLAAVNDVDPATAGEMLQTAEALLADAGADELLGDGDGPVLQGAEIAPKAPADTDAFAVRNMAQPGRPSPAAMQQQIFDQLAKGVLRGIQNGEHHLVLKLQPPELGEVKVDLLVRHDQLSISFSMENSRVKEALESSMQQFRDNLEQRGFVLEHCFVSVGGDQNPQENWRRFEEALLGKDHGRPRVVELPGEMLYQRNASLTATAGGLSLFV